MLMDRQPSTPSFDETSGECTRCEALRAEIDALKDENKRLKMELNAKTKEEVHVLVKRRKRDKTSDHGVEYQERDGVDETLTALLTRTPTVLEVVFRYLNSLELRRLSSVCRVWNQTADVVKRRRREPLIVIRAAPRVHKGINRSPYDVASMVRSFEERVLSCYSERDVGVVFIANVGFLETRRVENFLRDNDTAPEKLKYLIVNYYQSGNLIGSEDTSDSGYGRPRGPHFCNVPVISGVFFPDNIPGVQFFPFKITEEFAERPRDHNDVPSVTGIPPGTEVKCLLIFEASPFCVFGPNSAADAARAIMDYYAERRPLALGGTRVGFVSYLDEPGQEPRECRPSYVGCGLAFAGENFDAASVVIAAGARTREVVTRRLTELKGKITIRSRSLAFLFTSAAETEGDHYPYHSKDVESDCFREVFPNVPFLGMKSPGAYNIREIIGNKYFPDGKNVVIPPSLDVFVHDRSAALLLLTWGSLPDGACTASAGASDRNRHPKYNFNKRV